MTGRSQIRFLLVLAGMGGLLYGIDFGAIAAILSLRGELVARVETREGTPRIVVNGEETPARMFWGRVCIERKRTRISGGWCGI